MLSFKQFIAENEDLIASIPKRCAKFIEESDGLPLYRGAGNVPKDAIEKKIRTDRVATDSDDDVHHLMDAFFLKEVGAKVRSEGLFTTGRKAGAMNYGSPHFVFPVGNFKYVWGQTVHPFTKGEIDGPIRDTITLSRSITRMLAKVGKEKGDKVAEAILGAAKWNTDNLAEAIKSGAEIAILGQTAILVPCRELDANDYKKLILGQV